MTDEEEQDASPMHYDLTLNSKIYMHLTYQYAYAGANNHGEKIKAPV